MKDEAVPEAESDVLSSGEYGMCVAQLGIGKSWTGPLAFLSVHERDSSPSSPASECLKFGEWKAEILGKLVEQFQATIQSADHMH